MRMIPKLHLPPGFQHVAMTPPTFPCVLLFPGGANAADVHLEAAGVAGVQADHCDLSKSARSDAKRFWRFKTKRRSAGFGAADRLEPPF